METIDTELKQFDFLRYFWILLYNTHNSHMYIDIALLNCGMIERSNFTFVLSIIGNLQ